VTTKKCSIPYSSRKSVLVVSPGESIRSYLAILISSGLRPSGVLRREDGYPADQSVRVDRKLINEFRDQSDFSLPEETIEVPVLEGSDILGMIESGKSKLISDYHPNSAMEQFRKSRRDIRKIFGHDRHFLLHPSALAELRAFRRRTYLVAGSPGSGNMIVQRYIAEILERARATSASPQGPLESILSSYAISHWQMMGEALSLYFEDDGLVDYAGGPSGFGLLNLFVTLQPNQERAGCARTPSDLVCIGGIRGWHHAWANPFHGSHEALTRTAASTYGSRNVSCIQVVRHPLDVLVSVAGKVLFRSLGARAVEGGATRIKAVQSLMKYPDWVNSMIDALEEYYAIIAETASELHIVKYEELLSNPTVAVARLSGFLEVDISPNQVDEIVKKWSDKAAGFGPGHRWDPRAGKWKQFLSSRLASRLVGSRLHSAARELGYDFSADDFAGPDEVDDVIQLDSGTIAQEEGLYWMLVGQRCVEENGRTFFRQSDSGLTLSGPSSVEGAADRIITSSLIQDLNMAASFSRPSVDVSEDDYVGRLEKIARILS
jgi:hypothetical protein